MRRARVLKPQASSLKPPLAFAPLRRVDPPRHEAEPRFLPFPAPRRRRRDPFLLIFAAVLAWFTVELFRTAAAWGVAEIVAFTWCALFTVLCFLAWLVGRL